MFKYKMNPCIDGSYTCTRYPDICDGENKNCAAYMDYTRRKMMEEMENDR